MTASIVAMGFLLFGLAVKYLGVFPSEEMDEIAIGKLAELPAPAAFRQPLRSATTFAFVLGFVFMFGAVALSYDGIRLRVPVEPPNDQVPVKLDGALEKLIVPERLLIKTGPSSPGPVFFSHKQHVDANTPVCVNCHEGKFRLLVTSAELPPMKKMDHCGECHDGVKAVGIRDKARCDSCHERK